jgi:hypothetical protein
MSESICCILYLYSLYICLYVKYKNCVLTYTCMSILHTKNNVNIIMYTFVRRYTCKHILHSKNNDDGTFFITSNAKYLNMKVRLRNFQTVSCKVLFDKLLFSNNNFEWDYQSIGLPSSSPCISFRIYFERFVDLF